MFSCLLGGIPHLLITFSVLKASHFSSEFKSALLETNRNQTFTDWTRQETASYAHTGLTKEPEDRPLDTSDSLSTLKCVLMIVQQQYQSVRGLPDAAQTKQKSHISLHTFWPAPRNKESKSESNREPGVLRVLLQWGGSEASLGGTACSQRAKIPSASHRTSDRTWTSTVTTTHTHWSVSLIRFRWDDQAAPPQVSELL